MSGAAIRLARFPEDRATCAGFILGLQRYEHQVEPDRRIDDAVGGEFLDILLARCAKRNGCIWIAECDGVPAGWAVGLDEQDEIYIADQLRMTFLVQELFIEERFRGLGIGRLLLQAAEDEARRRNIPRLVIGVLARNRDAHAVYEKFGFRDYALTMEKLIRS